MGFKLAVLPGDGIGQEVTEAALQVLDAVCELGGIAVEREVGLIGGIAIDQTQDPFPPDTERLVHQADATLLGAVGGPKWADGPKTPEDGLLRLRASLGLYANLRPFEVLPGLEEFTPLKRPFRGGVIIRELLGGLYYGEPRGITPLTDGGAEAVDTARYTTAEIERVARIGFQLASQRGVPLMSVDKANVLHTSKLWRQTVIALGQRDYPGVPLTHRYVDAAAMEMVLAPERFQVVVTENLFGDILSDLTGGLVGSLGVLGSATVAGIGQGKGLYEPVHGSAPDIQGRGIANPIGAIWSLSLLLEWSFGLQKMAELLQQAVRETTKAGVRTPDLGGQATTREVTNAIVGELRRLSENVTMGER
ncbi:MAG: 3-isopropylmalate dehydrogenase [Firmicutes bacterium]|nr:3-isopropylmalate dehydrogenase [Bacillota bacterium]